MNHAHRDPCIVPEDPIMRAYWKYHVDGSHKIPREDVKPDHFYDCAWCAADHHRVWDVVEGRVVARYSDAEYEVFKLPQSAAADPMRAIRGRIG